MKHNKRHIKSTCYQCEGTQVGRCDVLTSDSVCWGVRGARVKGISLLGYPSPPSPGSTPTGRRSVRGGTRNFRLQFKVMEIIREFSLASTPYSVLFSTQRREV